MPKSTKLDILHTLLEMLRDTPLDEITVKDLTERCGISRQAFYYHFSDIYDAGSGHPVWPGRGGAGDHGADAGQPEHGAQRLPGL